MLFMSLILISNHSVFMEVLPNNMTSYNLPYTIKVHVHLHEIFTLRGSLDFFQVIMNSSSLAKSFRSTLLPIYS